jgi:hypothetical protein
MIPLFSSLKSKPRAGLIVALVLTAIAACATSTHAIPLGTYRERVRQATVLLSTLHSVEEGEEEYTHDERVSQALTSVRQLLPPTETVEWNGAKVQVDNKWLEDALKRYEGIPHWRKDREGTLTEVITRLTALSESLAEAEQQQNAAGSSNKDEEKARMSSILRRSDYAQKAPEESAVTRLWKRFVAWFRGLFPDRPSVGPGRAGALSNVAQIFVFVLAGAILAFVVWKLWPRLWRGRKEKKTKKREARVVLGERLEPDQSSADLLAEAEALARQGNLRAAIRKGYIALLCELGDRKVLGLAQHKTNRDYLRAVQSHEQLYREMKFLTFSFEHHWYGFLPATMEDWDVFRTRYREALKQ